MPLFGSQSKTQNTNAAQDLKRLARGLLPLGAEQRLRHDAETPGFTATLGAREFALLAGDDVLPIGIVTGSCVYHVGTVWPPMRESAELSVLTTAHLQVRRRALDRLQQEAALLGAHGVVDVKLQSSTRKISGEGGGELLEYSATGTAVRMTQGEPPPRPFLCNLTASEFWTLRRAGYRPCGIALGACIWYHVASPALIRLRGSRMGRGPVENQEYPEYSAAVQETRHLANDRLRQEAAQGLGEGVVGLYLTSNLTKPPCYGDSYTIGQFNLIVRVLALGTAITAHRDRWPILDYAVPLSG